MIKKNIIIPLIILKIIFNPGCKENTYKIQVVINPDLNKINNTESIKDIFPGSKIGYIIYDPEKKAVINSYNRNMLFIPASVTKIITTAAAINILGTDFKYSTTIGYTGSIDKGVLNGNLYIKGTGDPMLDVSHLMLMAEKMKNIDIKTVKGEFIFDDTHLYRSDIIDKDMHTDAAYNTGLSALSLWFNTIRVRWERKRKKGKIEYFTTPQLPLYSVELNKDNSLDSERFIYINTNNGSKWLIPSDIKRKGIKSLPVKDPGLYTAQMFAKICSLQGIRLPAPQRGKLPDNYNTIFEHKSRSLLVLSEIMLVYSNNLMAENVLLTAAKKISKRKLNPEKAGELIAKYLKQRINGINWNGFSIKNGSGLTSRNRISPEQMLGVLLFADSRDYKGKSYISLLPISGWKGSLYNRMGKPETAFQVWAKTGGINYSTSLAGYFFTRSKKKMLFAIFISDFKNRNILDADGRTDSKKASEEGAYRWTKRSTEVIDKLLLNWINEL